ncbi:MAG: aminoglycoside phosphotransferase [Novosphingobium sp. 32-60-15]|uniref:aminoglycoside phosphotransferase family protein n=1 Tax=unclassified Novosphingobium TaxID=2644732 RepID=UPI000BD419BD|nr:MULTISPECIES: phosphotransferase [unclassified Novosphingobium]OYX63692.1 MAG: aminoglycoside phosphotransferase [Novosphingobium sp. 32-60-15]
MDLTIPLGTEAFLNKAGWVGATIEPLPGDASFRRYFRIRRSTGTAMLMYAPPPNEDPEPFIRSARWLESNGMRAPIILAEQAGDGFVLLEDFGEVRMREYLDAWPQDEEEIYRVAIDALIKLRGLPPGPFTNYTLAEYQREARLFTEWYVPARELYVDGRGWGTAWDEALAPLLARQRPGVTVLRDYHAENVMLLGGLDSQGLLDFQDALVGHAAYDLVSLLQDARRDVSPGLEAKMLDYYLAQTGEGEDFRADYARLGAQRNAKIVGIFVRLWKRDGKPRYLDYIPRVWAALERDLAHPALAPVRAWFDANIPADVRANLGGTFAV